MLAEVSRAADRYSETRAGCAHLCGCKRASYSLDSAIYAGRMAEETWAALATAAGGVSHQRIQQRALRAAERLGPAAVDALAAGTPEEVELR